jgi:Fur family ferric uptake transcriptional regulator
MISMKNTDKDLRLIFSKLNIKYTKQRSFIYDLLENADRPMTVEDIFLRSKDTGLDINLSTVYRIIDMFMSRKVVSISGSEGKKAMYDLNRHEHRHLLICLKCKKKQILDHCPFDNYEKSLSKSTDFEITDHQLAIYGYCPVCKKGDKP